MRQKKIKNYLKYGILFFGIPFLLWNCEKEEIETLQDVDSVIKVKSFSELPSKLMKNIDFLNTTIKNRRTESNGILIVDESQIIEMIDSLDNTTYSVRILFENQPENILYNLILGTDSQDNEISPFVLKYTINNLEEIREENYLDFSRMAGKIDDFSLDRFLQYAENYLIESYSSNSVVDPCNPYDGSGGEFENPDDDDGNTNDDTDDCNINIWSNGETGDVFGITWSCSSGNSGSVGFRNTDCNGGTEGPSGGAGVNPGDNSSCTGGKIDDGNGNCVCPSGYVEDSGGNCVNPCDEIGNHLTDSNVASNMQILRNGLNGTAETGFVQRANGSFSPMQLSNNGHSLRFGRIAGNLGYMHSHTNPYQDNNGEWQYPVNIFSPRDIIAFLTMLKNIPNGHNQSEVYASVVTPNGTYTLRFTGSVNNIPSLGIYNHINLKREFIEKMDDVTRAGPTEEVFLNFFNTHFNINGINLYKVNTNNNTTSLLTIDNNGDVDQNPC
tara:strand:- start:534 stop:2027 length:1494 start_codon:yes stop_codon:yes gene_type:complete